MIEADTCLKAAEGAGMLGVVVGIIIMGTVSLVTAKVTLWWARKHG